MNSTNRNIIYTDKYADRQTPRPFLVLASEANVSQIGETIIFQFILKLEHSF